MKSVVRFLLISVLILTLSPLAGAAESAQPGGVKPDPVSPPESNPTSLLPPSPSVSQKPSVTPPPVQKSVRLGYIDLMRVNNESEVGKAVQKQLEARKKKLQGQIEVKRKNLEKMKSDIEAKIQSLAPPQREAKAKEFQKKVEEFQRFGQNSEKELQTLQQSLFSGLSEKLERACTEYGKAGTLALIIEKRALLYLESGVEAQDVTDGVIKLLNEKEPKK